MAYSKGIEYISDSIPNIAGYWTVGIAKGLAVSILPILAMSFAYGFAKKVIKIGAGKGGK